MTVRLTKKQQAVLDYIKTHIKERGFPPTQAEITQAFGWKSYNAAYDHLRAMRRRGVITIARGVARGISIVGGQNQEEMASALKVISTWALYDHENGVRKALDPKHVLDLCRKALKIEVAA